MKIRHHSLVASGYQLSAMLMVLLLSVTLGRPPQATQAASERFFVRQGDNIGKAPNGNDWIQTIQGAIIQAEQLNTSEPPVIEVWADGNICGSPCIFNDSLTITKPVRLIVKEGTGVAILKPALNNQRVILIDGSKSSITSENTEITGFTISNGNAASEAIMPGYGGGMLVMNASPLIRNNIIEENVANNDAAGNDAFGGGVFLLNSAAILRGNVIRNNLAGGVGTRRGHGGGVAVSGGSVTLEHNLIDNNSAATIASTQIEMQGIGGGVYLNTSTGAGHRLIGNIISRNVASISTARPSVAGGVYTYVAQVSMENNMIVRNLDMENGDGLWFDGATGMLLNNTIANNGGVSGVGIHVRFPSSTAANPQLSIINTIIAGHDIGVLADTNATVQLKATLFYAQQNLNTLQQDGGLISSSQAIEADPLFVDASNDNFHIQRTSPAINAGSSAPLSDDIDRQPRWALPDLGADEYASSIYLPLILR